MSHNSSNPVEITYKAQKMSSWSNIVWIDCFPPRMTSDDANKLADDLSKQYNATYRVVSSTGWETARYTPGGSSLRRRKA